MIIEEKNENLDICRECGGKCCIKCGCDYGVTDFESRIYKSFLSELEKGDKSIVATINFRVSRNGDYIADPILYIRARNVNRDIVDLVSMKTRCAQLGENGCKYDYEHRPLGGRNLKPVRMEDGGCVPIIPPLYLLEMWLPYQKQLRKIVKYYTGMSVDEKISQDVENLIYDVLIGSYENVSSRELYELKNFVPMLTKGFSNEAYNAYKRYEKSSYNILEKNKK